MTTIITKENTYIFNVGKPFQCENYTSTSQSIKLYQDQIRL